MNEPYWDQEGYPNCYKCGSNSLNMAFCITCGISLCWACGLEHVQLNKKCRMERKPILHPMKVFDD